MKISTENIQKKSAYIAPMLTEVEFRVERGFAESGSDYYWDAPNTAQRYNDQLNRMAQWMAGDQEVSGLYNPNSQMDLNGLAAGEFVFYNTNDNEHGWF